MSYTYADGRALDGKQVLTFPLVGALDLVTDKLSVNPGTLQEVLNYEVNITPGYSQCMGIVEYGLKEHHVPYFVKIGRMLSEDETPIKIFEGGIYSTTSGAKVKILTYRSILNIGGPNLYIINFRVIKGEVGNQFDIIAADGTTYSIYIDEQSAHPYSYDAQKLDDYISSFTVTDPNNRVPGQGPITSLFFLDDKLHAVRDDLPELTINLPEAVEGSLYSDSIEEGDVIRVSITKDDRSPGIEEVNFYARAIAVEAPKLNTTGSITAVYLDLADRIKYDTTSPYNERLSTYEEVKELLQTSLDFDYPVKNWYALKDVSNAVDSGSENVYDDFYTNFAAARGLTADEVNITFEEKEANKGLLWKESESVNRDRIAHWEQVDLGHEVQFDTGTTTPLVALNRIFIDSDFEIFSLGPYTSEIQVGNWRQKENVQEVGSPESWAYDGLSFSASSNLNIFRNLNTLTLKDFGIKLPTHTVLTGITVKVRMAAWCSAAGADSDVDVYDGAIFLTAGSNSLNKANNDSITVQTIDSPINPTVDPTFTEVTYGGEDDLWGLPGIPTEILESEDFAVNIRPKMIATTNPGSVVFVGVSYVEVTVHYQDGTERVYFYDPDEADDVATADIVNYSRSDGAWDTNDAEGILSLYNLDESTAAVKPGLDIYTGAGATGNLIGKTTSGATPISLPTSSALEATDSKILTIRSNFYSDRSGEAIYGVTGTTPAFFYNGKYFSYIRIPELSADKDIPRHVYNNQQHLVLGYPSGQALISTGGNPVNFETAVGSGTAVEVGFGDKITGFRQIAGDALGVFCETSAHVLTGNSAATFIPRPISLESGAIEYTVSAIGQPIYCDTRGITDVGTTDKYGDFNWKRISKFATPWLQSRLQGYGVNSERRPVFALPVKNKNQYRLFFEDGYIVTLSILEYQNSTIPMVTLSHYDTFDFSDKYVPVCGISEVLSNGKEVSVIGTSNGKIFVLDAAPGITTEQGRTTFDCEFTLNPFNGNATPYTMRYNQVYFHGTTPRPVELNITAGVNYLVPEVDSYEDTKIFGYEGEQISTNRINVPAHIGAHIPSLTDGYSLKVSSVSNRTLPHVLQAVTLRPVVTSDKTSHPRSSE